MAKTYDIYKDSGVAWIGEIPSEWEVKRLGSFYNPRNEKVSDIDYEPLSVTMKGIVPQLETAAKTNDGDNRKLVLKGDFVINSRSDRRGSCGISNYAGSVSLINTVLSPNGKMDADFYNWLFHTSMFADEYYKWGHGIVDDLWTTRWSEMKNINVVTPPLSEQQIIASFLDKKCVQIDTLISLQEEMISELQAYKHSVITEAVTKGLDPNAKMRDSGIEWIGEIPENWKIKLLSKIIWLRARLGWKGLKAEEYVEFGYPFLSAFNIINNQLIWSDLNYINKQRYDESPEIKLSIGDVLIVKDGAGIGKTARVDSLPYGEATVNSSLGVITPSEILAYQYLYYFLLSNPFQNMVGFLKNGMGVPHLTQENMKSALIPIPPLSEQQAIASYLDEKTARIDSLISLKQEKITELKNYKKSIIYEYVTGKKRI